MRSRIHGLVAFAALLLWGAAGPAFAEGSRVFTADLDGYQQAPSFSTTGTGEIWLKLNRSGDAIEYELSWENLESLVVLFAHLHIGRPGTNGGTIAFLCANAPPRPDTPTCPLGGGGTVTGTLDASKVIGPVGQGIAPGEFDELVRALRDSATYVNVHSAAFSPGEIRGDIRPRRRDDWDDRGAR